ncbi:MAG: DNRLRE domain-containing protein [archaeon]|nr:MAG: DNRLRE domain-containing protein [archaeon]
METKDSYGESISILVSGPPKTPFSLTVIDQTGREVFSRASSTDSLGSYFLSLPLENGDYVAIISSGQTVRSKEFAVGAVKDSSESVSEDAQPVYAPAAPLISSPMQEAEISNFDYGPTWTESCKDTCTRSLYSGKMNMEDSEGIYRPFNELVGFAYNASSKNLELEWNGKTANLEPYAVIGGFEQEVPAVMNFRTEIEEGPGYYKWSHLFTNAPGLESFGLTISSGSGVVVLDNDTLLIGELEIDFSDLYNKTCDGLGNCTTSGILVETKQINENTADIRISNFTGAEVVLDPTVQLQAPGSENLDDTNVRSDKSGDNYGTDDYVTIRDRTNKIYRTYIKFNISSVPSGKNIDKALLCLYLYIDGSTSQSYAHHVYNHTWTELGITWNDQPCGTGLDNSLECNLTAEDVQTTTGTGWLCWNVTNTVRSEYESGDGNVSVVLVTPETGSESQDDLYSKEYATTSLRPYMNITYSKPPTYSGETVSPVSGSNYSPSQSYQFNLTWDDESGIDQTWLENNFTGSMQNDTVTTYRTISGNQREYYFDVGSLAAGTYVYKWYANSTGGQMNDSFPQTVYSVNKATPSISVGPLTTVVYPSSTQTGCERLAGDSTSTLTLYRNDSQVAQGTTSPINESSVILGAAVYNYTCAIAETENYTSYSLLNQYRNVNKGILDLQISGGGTWTYPHESGVTGTESDGGDSDVTYELWRNDSLITNSSPYEETALLAAGSYTYRFNSTGGANWTANLTGVTAVVTIQQNQSNPVELYFRNSSGEFLNQNMSVVYEEATNATGAALYTGSGTVHLYRDGADVTGENGQSLVLGAKPSGYAYKVNITGNVNYTSNFTGQTFYLTVGKRDPSSHLHLAINGSEENQDLTYPVVSNVTAWSDAIQDLTFSLYRNDTPISLGSPVSDLKRLGVNLYSYLYNTSGGENYTSGSVTRLLNITKGPTEQTLLLNGTRGNKKYIKGQIVELKTTLNVSGKYLYLYANFSGPLELIDEGPDPLSNTTNTSNINYGKYLVKANWTGDENYTTDEESWIMEVSEPIENLYFRNDTTVLTGGNFYRLNGTNTASGTSNSTVGAAVQRYRLATFVTNQLPAQEILSGNWDFVFWGQRTGTSGPITFHIDYDILVCENDGTGCTAVTQNAGNTADVIDLDSYPSIWSGSSFNISKNQRLMVKVYADVTSSGGRVANVYWGDSTYDSNVTKPLGILDYPPAPSDEQINVTDIYKGTTIKHSVYWSDDKGLDTYKLSWNATGAGCDAGFQNESSMAWAGEPTGAWSNVTRTVPDSCLGKVIAWKIYANDTRNNNVVSDELSYEVLAELNITVNTTLGPSSNTNIRLYNSTGSLITEGQGNISTDVDAYELYDISLRTELSSGFQETYLKNVNISDNLNITSQIVETYTGTFPQGISNVTPVYAQKELNVNYDYATLCIPKAGVNVSHIAHCTNWDYKTSNCSSWEVNETSDYNMQENSTHIWFNVTEFDAYGGGQKALLNVTLNTPPDNTIVPQYRNFTINATVICLKGNCGLVKGYVRYNSSGNEPDTDIPENSGTPFYTFDSNPQQQNLGQDENATMVWSVNSTGTLGDFYEIGAYFETSQISNHTENSTVEIGKVLVMSLTFDTVSFGVLDPGEAERPALNNSDEYYNISVDPNSNDLDYLWIKATDMVGEAWANYDIGPGNISWSFENNPSTGSAMEYSYSLMDQNVPSGQNKTTYYWLNVPYGKMAQNYVGTMTIMANATW